MEFFSEFLTVTPSTVIISLLNLLILFLFIRHFFFDKVNAVIESRQHEIDSAFNDADEATKRAKQLEEDYTQKMLVAKEESAEIVKSATKKAQTRSDEIIFDAKAEANSII